MIKACLYILGDPLLINRKRKNQQQSRFGSLEILQADIDKIFRKATSSFHPATPLKQNRLLVKRHFSFTCKRNYISGYCKCSAFIESFLLNHVCVLIQCFPESASKNINPINSRWCHCVKFTEKVVVVFHILQDYLEEDNQVVVVAIIKVNERLSYLNVHESLFIPCQV